MLAAVPAGANPAGGECPDATVVISGNVKGDRYVESPDVDVSGAGENPVRSAKEASNLTGRSESEPVKPRHHRPHRKRMVGDIESAEPFLPFGEDQCRR